LEIFHIAVLCVLFKLAAIAIAVDRSSTPLLRTLCFQQLEAFQASICF
jgi:hypothetical protein